MPEMSGVRRKQMHEEGQKVSLWSLIFEKQEREAREKEMKKRKGKRIKWGLLFLPLLCMAEPNGYFSWDRATDTFTMIADEAQVDTVNASSNVVVGGSLTVTNGASVGGDFDVTGEITAGSIDYVIADTNVAASANYVGKTRYYTTASNSYVDVCMQTGTNSYTWVNIQSYGW